MVDGRWPTVTHLRILQSSEGPRMPSRPYLHGVRRLNTVQRLFLKVLLKVCCVFDRIYLRV